VSALVEELMEERGAERVGEVVEVLVEDVEGDDGRPVGRAAHQGPDVDGVTVLDVRGYGAVGVVVGDLVRAEVVAANGAELVARPIDPPLRGARP
jgi:tRNA A37 methylthiotransferase MiaB